ncbi:MAG: cation transporter [Deltaproteobacteria bacterium]|nr:cation transporter [Deltaproteobacteria bacterium]
MDSSEISNHNAIRFSAMVGLAVNIILSIFKFTAGFLGHSHTMIADATHSLSDCITDLALIAGVKYWSLPPDENHPYGHQKIENIISVFIGLFLAVAGVGILYDSIIKIHEGQKNQPTFLPLAAAFISIISKELLYHWTADIGKRTNSMAVVANAWHHRADGFSSIPAALAISTAMIFPGLVYLDLIGAMLICVFIMVTSWKIILEALSHLSDEGIGKDKLAIIHEIIKSIPEIKDFHAIRTRKAGNVNYLDLHILVDPEMTVKRGHDISEVIENAVPEKMSDSNWDVLVHIEPWDKHQI